MGYNKFSNGMERQQLDRSSDTVRAYVNLCLNFISLAHKASLKRNKRMWVAIHLLGAGSSFWALFLENLDAAKHVVLYTLAIIYLSAMTFFYVVKGFFWIYREYLSLKEQSKKKP